MNLKIVLLIGLIGFATTASASNDVAKCLSMIDADDGHVGKYANAKAKVTMANKKNTKVEKKGRLLQSIAETSTLTALIKSYYSLSEETQAAIKKCNVPSGGAMSRCQQKFGANGCESRGPGLAAPKCKEGSDVIRHGHSICTTSCPVPFTDRGLDCYKPRGYKTKRYSSMKECNKTHKTCERYSLKYYVPVCQKYFTRQGPDGCIPTCPENWVDLGRKCLRPYLEVKEVFAWKQGDN